MRPNKKMLRLQPRPFSVTLFLEALRALAVRRALAVMPALTMAVVSLACISAASADDSTNNLILKSLKPRSPRSLMVLLANEKVRPEELRKRSPLEFLTAGGSTIKGYLLGADEGAGYVSILGQHGELTTLAYDKIEGIRIENPTDYGAVLAPGVLLRSSNEAAPGMLELDRRAGELHQSFGFAVSIETKSEFEQNADCRRNLKDVLQSTGTFLEKTKGSKIGADALKAISTISFAHSGSMSGLEAKKDGKQINISFDCKAPLNTNLAADIEENLNKLL